MIQIMMASVHLHHTCNLKWKFYFTQIWTEMLNIICYMCCSVYNSLANPPVPPDPCELLLSSREWNVHPLWNCTCGVLFSGWYQESVPHLDQPRWVHSNNICLIWLYVAILSRQGIFRTWARFTHAIRSSNSLCDFIYWRLFCSFILHWTSWRYATLKHTAVGLFAASAKFLLSDACFYICTVCLVSQNMAVLYTVLQWWNLLWRLKFSISGDIS